MKKNSIILTQLLKILPVILIILISAYFRFRGINWDQDFHLHPDERFLTMVETSITPVASLPEFFNTDISRLNPHNILDANGNSVFPFFVYGTLPLFIVRYVAEWIGQTGYNQIFLVGRYLSGIFDIGTVILVYFASKIIFSKKWLSYLAAFLYASFVLPIQISHFFIVDNFTTFFSTLALYAAINIWKSPNYSEEKFSYKVKPLQGIFNFSGFKYYYIFAIAFGMALASKVNAGVIIILLPFSIYLKEPSLLKYSSSSNWQKQFHHLIFSGIISFIVFRILQPYAFTGPGFFNIIPNSKWINNLKELAALSSGSSNYPPSLQWARRSFWFPIKNMIVWGMGLPAGIFAFAGLIFMGWKIINGQIKKYGLIWVFTIGYLVWQAFRWNPTMRYFLLIYPFLSMIAAWFLNEAIEFIKKIANRKLIILKKSLIVIVCFILIFGTVLWAFSFINIYLQPMTRIAASEWIYENAESAVNLFVQDQDDTFSQPLAYTHFSSLEPRKPIEISFTAETNGVIKNLTIDHIVSPVSSDISQDLSIQLIRKPSNEVIYSEIINDAFQRENDSRGKQYDIFLAEPYKVKNGEDLSVKLELLNGDSELNFSGYLSTSIQSDNSIFSQTVFEFVKLLDINTKYQISFKPFRDGLLTGLQLFRVKELDNLGDKAKLSFSLMDDESGEILRTWDESIALSNEEDFRGSSYTFQISDPVPISSQNSYSLVIKLKTLNKIIALNGSKSAKESDWDDALPLYMHGLNPFDLNEGIYPSELNFQMYWDDNSEKFQRFIDYLSRTDYIIFSSNRQWGSTTQIPERYPLTSLFYKELLGCQTDDIQWCYSVAKPEMFSGKLGFDLIKTFQVNPSIFTLEFNSQFAEEAFTVYDHPKVFIFKKTQNFDINSIIKNLSSVNLNQVLNLSPKEADKRPGNLMLTEGHIDRQKSFGTWSDIFNYNSLQNKYPLLTIIFWYFAISVIGWLFYPLNRIIYKKLPDKGFPLKKLTSLVIIALPIWFASSLGFAFDNALILVIIFGFFILNLVIFLRDKKTIVDELNQNYQYLIKVELIGLSFFLFFLFIRLGNPDLWHPYKGGEKPMDFSYFNAVIKSVGFPPYDPWYSGGYINYYYYGFVIAALPVKLLGIIPSVAYNLILPTFFSFTALVSFSLGWNLNYSCYSEKRNLTKTDKKVFRRTLDNPYFAAIITSVFVLIIGNLGTVRMFFQGLFNLGSNSLAYKDGNLFQVIQIFINGLQQFFTGTRFDFYPGDWYWIPSRAIPGEPITEFPFFTFLYGDPHAHLFAYPITLLALSWSLSVILGKLKYSNKFEIFIHFIAGATIIGSLRAINTWDYPTFLGIAIISICYTNIKYGKVPEKLLNHFSSGLKQILVALFTTCVLILLTIILYFPFIKWFGQGYSSVSIWEGDKTPIGSYLVHWGFFLTVIYTWLILEIYQWMASTPLSSLWPYYPYRKYFVIGLMALLIIGATGFIWGVKILLVIFPALISIFFLIFRKTYSDSERFVLFLVGAGYMLTLFVEMLVLKGDIGRMNTVFKFYLQAWTFFALGSAYFLPGLFNLLNSKKTLIQLKKILITIFILLMISVLLFPITASLDKISDRISKETPVTLDGMYFMNFSKYNENEIVLNLSHDYKAIKWIQENIKGTPTIVEANTPEYRWGSRFSIYTGLPGVLGWNWHQRQQRAINPPEWVFERVDEIREFYSTTDLEFTKAFIEKYGVDYIIVGQLEKAAYPSIGLEKFVDQNTNLWDSVYSSEDTVIYKVNK